MAHNPDTHTHTHANRKPYHSGDAPRVSCGLCGCCRWICGQARNRGGCAPLCSVCDEGWYHPLHQMSWSNWAPGRGGVGSEIGKASRPSLLSQYHTLRNLKNSLKAHYTHKEKKKQRREKRRWNRKQTTAVQMYSKLSFHWSNFL